MMNNRKLIAGPRVHVRNLSRRAGYYLPRQTKAWRLFSGYPWTNTDGGCIHFLSPFYVLHLRQDWFSEIGNCPPGYFAADHSSQLSRGLTAKHLRWLGRVRAQLQGTPPACFVPSPRRRPCSDGFRSSALSGLSGSGTSRRAPMCHYKNAIYFKDRKYNTEICNTNSSRWESKNYQLFCRERFPTLVVCQSIQFALLLFPQMSLICCQIFSCLD